VIDTVVSKYCDHQPLYRQSAMLERDSGVELSRATLDGWVLKAGELLIPMAAAMRQEICCLPECVRPVGTWDNPTLQQTGWLQSEMAWDISARQSDGHFRAPI
jgi:hypothetical protein